jgi:MFS family permease
LNLFKVNKLFCLKNLYIYIFFSFFLGLTHAAVWATACSYLSQAAPENLRLSCQGVLQGFHFGFGRGCGALFGGFFASYFGTDITFRAYGIICLIFMVLFIYLNQRYQQHYASNYGQNLNVDDPHQFIGNSPLLAPYGAPTNPKWQTKFSSGNYLFIFYSKFNIVFVFV